MEEEKKKGFWEKILKREVYPEERKALDKIMDTSSKLAYDIYMYPFLDRGRMGTDIDKLIFLLEKQIGEWKEVRAKIKKKEVV